MAFYDFRRAKLSRCEETLTMYRFQPLLNPVAFYSDFLKLGETSASCLWCSPFSIMSFRTSSATFMAWTPAGAPQ